MKYALVKDSIVVGIVEATTQERDNFKQYWEATPVATATVEVGMKYSNGVFSIPDPTPAYFGTRISVLSFLKRFTDAEAIAIDLGSIGATVQAASLRRYLNMVNAAKFIDLSREDTRAGVQALETNGILAAGRAAQILDTPIKADEVA